MAESASDSKGDELERDNLQRAIAEAETALAKPGAGPRPILQTFIQNAKGRVATLDKKIKESATERAQEKSTEVAAISEAQKETALNAKEREAYGGFLKEDFFTKKDFGRLEEFYSKTWDRLSDSGKDQMSHRFWEGIRRNEYEFKDAPKGVQEKETQWAYTTLVKREKLPFKDAIPEKDRQDFIEAYESGHRDEASKILTRESFKNNLFQESGSTSEKKHSSAVNGRESDRDAITNRLGGDQTPREKSPSSEKAAAKTALDVSSLNLDGVKLEDAPAKVSSADIPAASTPSDRGGPSFRGG